MNYEEARKRAVFSSSTGWTPTELRFVRGERTVVEASFSREGDAGGSHVTLRMFEASPSRVAYELFLGFDCFLIVDLKKKDWQREVGRFEMHIFRNDGHFMFAFDSYEIEEVPNQSPQRNAGSRPSSGDSPASETSTSLGPRG